MLTRGTRDPAVTRFTSAAVAGRRPGLRAFLLKPETGRTHQLRVALKSLGSPLLGDEVRAGRGLRAGTAVLRAPWLVVPCASQLGSGAAKIQMGMWPNLVRPAIPPSTPRFPLLATCPNVAVCPKGGGGGRGPRIPALRGAAVPAAGAGGAGGVPARARRGV